MKIAIYSKEGNLSTCYEDMKNPVLIGATVEFDGGSFSDLTDNHIFIGDNVDVPMTLEEAKQLDQKSILPVIVSQEEENENLKRQLADTNALILDFMESILG